MCAANKRFFLYLFFAFLFVFVVGVLRAEETQSWYLISEMELQKLEESKTKSEQDRASWLSQVQRLRIRAESLQAESESLNYQLANERQMTEKLSKSFSQYEQDALMTISQKNGEIATLEREKAEQELATAAEKLKTQKAVTLNIILGGIIAVIVIVAAIKIYLKIKTGGISGLLKFFRPP